MLLMALYYCRVKKATQTLKMALIFGILILIINPLINHRGSHILFYLIDNPVTLEATLYGFINMLMVISLLLLFASFNVLLNSERFLYLFSWALPQVSFIVSMSLRYVSLFAKRAKELSGVLALRGIDIKKGKKTDILKNSSKILMALTQWSMEDGMDIAQSLKAKGYATKKRTTYQRYTFTRRR